MKQWNHYTSDDLTLVICAYKECEYLEESLISITNQTMKPRVLISTSTPNDFINKLAEKYNIEVRVNPNGGQIEDYNFAIKQADTDLVMLAHQDEILHQRFVEESLFALNHAKDPIISFTDYIEMHDNKVDDKQSSMIKIKKLLLTPIKVGNLRSTKFGKRLIQRFGDPITHPSVICVKKHLPDEVFREKYKAAMDWDLWERLSLEDGSFVYVDKILLYHRMNDENQTVLLLKTTNERYENESEIFSRFWPKGIVKVIMKYYSKAANYY